MDESTNSCGTISSRSTASQASVDGPALLRELERLRSGLSALLSQKLADQRARDDVGAMAGERLLVLSCLAKGISLEDWRTLAQGEDAEQWYAFELDPARNPQLAAASVKGLSLQQTVCPETGLLLAPFFQKQLGAELDRARKTGNGPAVLLFEIVNGPCRMEARPAPRREPTLSQIFAGNVAPEAEAEPSPQPEKVEAAAPLTLDDRKKLALLAQTLRAHARGCDVPARMETSLALLMPGAGVLRARAFAERLVLAFDEALRRVSGGQPVRLALRAGIAGCEIDDMPDAAALLARAEQALKLAQPGGTRTYRKNDMGASERKTQVQACEKQFLFFGATESR